MHLIIINEVLHLCWSNSSFGFLPPLLVEVMTSAIMLMDSGLPDQKMLEVRNLFTEARVLNSVRYNKHLQLYR